MQSPEDKGFMSWHNKNGARQESHRELLNRLVTVCCRDQFTIAVKTTKIY